MSVLFFSDAHGALCAMKRLIKQVELLQPHYVAFLGDALYHGPRNPILIDYDPKKVAELFNSLADLIVTVRGNCDSEVDQMLIEFPILSEYAHLAIDQQRFFLSHGHIWNAEKQPKLPAGSILTHGHTHVALIEKLPSGLIHFNPGSIALPKSDLPPTFGFYENDSLSVRDLQTGETYIELTL